MPQPASMLAPYRVLDLTDARAELATFVLAGLGADVIKVEPPGGSASRSEAPRGPAQPAALASLRFHAFNRGKRSVVLELDSARGRDDFLALVASADFVFENAAPGALDARGLGFSALREARPDLVYVAISPFGQTGPYARHAATDLTLSAMGGAMALNGEPDRRPVRITVPQTWHHAAVESAVGALAAHQRRLLTGAAQFVDVSVQAAVFWTGLNAMIAHAIQGKDIERNGTVLQLSTLVTPLVYPCADGEVVLIATKVTLLALIPWMIESGAITRAWAEAEDWSSYELRMLTGAPLVHSVEAMRAAVTEFTRTHAKAALFEGGIARGVTLAPVNTAADVMALEQLALRGYWEQITLPSGRELRAPGAFVRASRTPVAWTRPAPDVGEHTAEVLGELGRAPGAAPARPALSAARVRAPHSRAIAPAAPARLPFEGVKFADFSWIGVGPITAKALADHGATVVHVETNDPADRLRLVGPFKDGVPGINRCQFFGSFNTSKLSLHLNLKQPDGLAIAKRLLQWADVALDSFTAGTMADFGLGYDVARALNPSLIMASTCLLGQTGPAARLGGYGYHAAAVSGFYEVTGWNDRAPAGPFNAYTDTIAPRFLAATLMAALDHRRRTGEGQFIDQAQMESSLHFLAPELLAVQLTGESPRRAGNASPTAAPHDAYPCAGHDQWCAIAVESDAHWLALRRALGEPAWMKDDALSGAAGRLARRAEIDDQLARFTAGHEPRALMELLQAAGVPAGMVQRSSDHQRDPQLAHRAFFRPLLHPEMGVVPYEGHAYRIAGYDNGPRFAAPCLGEHTYQVLSEVLGMSDDEVARVMSSGACG
jgi:crotonobetainyl-CoA:carnitine CoA-transferase CaiB-like acyl-CoA transferase